MANYVFGIDVGGTSVKCGLFQTDGTLLEKWEIPTRTENGGSEILPDIAKSVKAKMAEKGIAADRRSGRRSSRHCPRRARGRTGRRRCRQEP